MQKEDVLETIFTYFGILFSSRARSRVGENKAKAKEKKGKEGEEGQEGKELEK